MKTKRKSAAPQILNAPQREVVERGLLTSGFSCVLQMPTGSGKTWLAELAIDDVLARGAKAIYLTPLRALATELLPKWRERFPNAQVGVFTGDYGTNRTPFPVPFRDAQVLVMTPERLDACTRNWRSHWEWIPEVDLVIVDELHLLADPRRGPRLEGAILRIRRLNPFLRFLGLSATIGNRAELADWLEGTEHVSEWRPIPLQWRIRRFRKASEKPALAAEEVSHNAQAGGKSLVFVQSRRRAEELSLQLQSTGLRAAHHHAGLRHADREIVEKSFRESDVDVLVCTSTLEMGLNLPVRQVILYDLQRFDGKGFSHLSTISVWQRVGRAGRRGLDATGEAVLLAPSWDKHADRYHRGRFEVIRSGLSDQRALAEQVLAEVASGLSRNRDELERPFGLSLARRQKTLPNMTDVVSRMVEAGMLHETSTEDNEDARPRLKATVLGRIAVRHMLTPETLILFSKALKTSMALTFIDLLIVMACAPDAEPVLLVDFEELDALASCVSAEPSLLLQMIRPQLVQSLDVDGRRLLAAFKMALIVREWTRTGNADEVSARHDVYTFEVERLVENLERLSTAFSSVASKIKEDESPRDHELELGVPIHELLGVLSKMISSGLDETTATLTLVDGIGPKTARKLAAAGLKDIEDLAAADAAELSEIPGISSRRAEQWIDVAFESVSERSAFRYREDIGAVAVAAQGWPPGVDPYRLRRALDLEVKLLEAGRFLVTGGLDPHLVSQDGATMACDCIDFSRGHVCKHVLGVRLSRGDDSLEHLTRKFAEDTDQGGLDLFSLWFEGSPFTSARAAV